MRHKTQCEKIVEYMNEYGGITDRGATKLGCRRLAARIHDLKHKYGYKIETIPMKVRNMDGSSATVAYYRFKRAEE